MPPPDTLRRAASVIAGMVAGSVCVLALVACGAAAHPRTPPVRPPSGPPHVRARDRGHPTRRVPVAAVPRRAPFAVGLRVLHLVDDSRTIRLPDGRRRARPLTTIVRYPTRGAARRLDVRDARPDRLAGPFPLVVFGHGFAVTPATYSRLLRAWAAAGFVVAAPVFPLENADAPGGPDERDLVNQPRDMRFVIDRLLGADARPHGWASGLIARAQIAVAGQSDGGETALAVAYDIAYRDPRIRAVVLLSGAQLPYGGRSSLVARGPALLAVQGSADPINPPARTAAFVAAVRPPKFLLTLLGATHLAPYSTEQPQLTIVERASIAFLRAYLEPGASRGHWLGLLRRAARRPGLTTLLARP